MAEKKIICPLMGGACIEDGAVRENELVACRFWVQVQGKHPQTGAVVNNGDCAMAWMPVLLIENSKVNRETGAAVESLRNENAKAGNGLIALMGAAISAQPRPQVVAPQELLSAKEE